MQVRSVIEALRWLFDSSRGARYRLAPRWLFLRALAAIYFSAFYSLLFQIRGLIGPTGILPAREYLALVAQQLYGERYWYAPSLFWISSSDAVLLAVTWIGIAAALAAFANLWPRFSFFVCFVCFLSFVGASSTFSSYQSDGMLLEAGFLALFFSPPGFRPGLGAAHPPSRAILWLLQWEWFRIYFESGLVKLISGDPEWRNFTAMDEYYQNGPLPTWIGWYTEHLPHGFHAFTAGATLVMELLLVCLMIFPRRVRLILFLIVTPWEIGVILTANYAFLNYLVLALGILLLDDRYLRRLLPRWVRPAEPASECAQESFGDDEVKAPKQVGASTEVLRAFGLCCTAVMLTWIAYNTTAEMVALIARRNVLPSRPIELLDPLRIANQYGLFAVMTHGRYEIEFQGSSDGKNWVAYPFRNKPQALDQAPGIYAPYQPRFDWNLWFASLGDWRQNEIVPLTEERLLENDGDVLALFRTNPFARQQPRFVRAVLWQYWFTSVEEKRRTGNWWRRDLIGMYAPELTTTTDGGFAIVQMPEELPPHD
jgi:hypothetical protein